MNERIQELAEQADLLGDFTPTKINGRYVGYINVADIEKFAELIIKECMEIADTYQNRGGNCYVDNMIRQHFGLKR